MRKVNFIKLLVSAGVLNGCAGTIKLDNKALTAKPAENLDAKVEQPAPSSDQQPKASSPEDCPLDISLAIPSSKGGLVEVSTYAAEDRMPKIDTSPVSSSYFAMHIKEQTQGECWVDCNKPKPSQLEGLEIGEACLKQKDTIQRVEFVDKNGEALPFQSNGTIVISGRSYHIKAPLPASAYQFFVELKFKNANKAIFSSEGSVLITY